MLDAIIIGAGAAGLACARVLQREGREVAVLEARSRAGGRAFTAYSPNLAVPLELGAEFVHGAPKEILDPARDHSLPFFDVPDRHLYEGKGEDVDFFTRVEELLRRFRPGRKDTSVRDALISSRADEETKKMFRSFVEGFHAADLQQIGLNGLLRAEEEEESSLNGCSLFRLSKGYGDFFSRHFLSDPALASAIVYQAPVSRVERLGDHVHVHYAGGSSKLARCVVVTVPLGVLQAGSIRFEPEPEEFRETIFSLRSGHVARIVFQFRSRFWEKGLKKPPCFFHVGPENAFPTWWTLAPLRAPVLVAWQGGPNAEEVLSSPVSDRVHMALSTLEKITGRPLTELRRELVTYSHHDWTHDPYSYGAYSYVAVGGSARARRFAEPFGEHLLFAGEATMDGPARGTVHGAIRSGERAARILLRDGLSSPQAA